MVKSDELKDDETAILLASDPFHKGLTEHGELPRAFAVEALTDADVEASQTKLDRLMERKI